MASNSQTFQAPWLLRHLCVIVALAVAVSSAMDQGRCDSSSSDGNGSCEGLEDAESPGDNMSDSTVAAALEGRPKRKRRLEGESLGAAKISVLCGFGGFTILWIAATVKWACDGSLPARLYLWGLLPEAFAAISVKAVTHLLRLKSDPTPVVMLRNCVTDAGALQFAEALKLYGKKADLVALEFPFNHQMRATGIRGIVDVVLQEGLTLEELDLSYNPQLGDSVLEAIEPLLVKKGSHLNTLKLADCGLRKSSLTLLRETAPRLRLTTVDLSGNPLAGAGEAISELLLAPLLEELALACCGLEIEDVEQIAEQLPFTSLKTLQLGGNSIRKKGLEALTDQLPNCQVEELGLEGNELRAADLDCLGTAWVKRPFSRLRLNDNAMSHDEMARFIMTLRSMS